MSGAHDGYKAQYGGKVLLAHFLLSTPIISVFFVTYYHPGYVDHRGVNVTLLIARTFEKQYNIVFLVRTVHRTTLPILSLPIAQG